MNTEDSQGMSSSFLTPVPITPRTATKGSIAHGAVDEEEMELLRLGVQDSNGYAEYANEQEEEGDSLLEGTEKKPTGLSKKDKQAAILLIILYLIQGVPVGLAMGSMPFLLKNDLSYSQLAVFSLSAYPYSMKLLWSPIVDSKFIPSIGRRKSWIIPMQLVIGTTLLWISARAENILDHPETKVNELTMIFTTLVFISATQDIAVDGWALTLLSEENLSYASTCQTIGLNSGFFASFTLFLAFSSPEFAAMVGLPVLTLKAYLRFWSIICYCVTIWLVFFKKEDPVSSDDPDLNTTKVYKIMWRILRLRHVWILCIVHFISKIGTIASDSITSLKLVEKGLRKEQLSIIVTIDFVVQIFGGYYAAAWAKGNKPLRPWYYAYWVRLGLAITSMGVIAAFPEPPISTAFLVLVGINYITTQFASTIQFVGMSAFHTKISDPIIGGTYMTLLNTASNLGGTWPKFFVLKGVDLFSQATCHIAQSSEEILVKATECVSEPGKNKCKELGGECITETDGYFIVSSLCILTGALLMLFFVYRCVIKLQALPISRWRIGNLS